MKRRVANRGLKRSDGRKTDPTTVVEELAKQRMVLQMSTQGMSNLQIAQKLNMDPKTISRLWSRAHAEYLEDHKKFVAARVAKAMARYDAIYNRWWLEAVGGTFIDKNGKEITVPKNPDAVKIILRAQRDENMLLGHGATLRIEHSGPAGGPIETLQVDAMETARLIRASFGDAVAKNREANNGTIIDVLPERVAG